MKKQRLTAALALICLVGLSVGARAENKTEVVNIPFEFVAGGKTLSPGTYSVSRVSLAYEPSLILLIRSRDEAVYVHPVAFNDASDEEAQLNFEHVGDKYLLSKVRTSEGVYTIGDAVTKMGQKRAHDVGMSSSGTN